MIKRDVSGLLVPRQRRPWLPQGMRPLCMAAPQQALLMGNGTVTDPNFSSVVLLLDASNLANNSMSFTDYSSYARALTANGNAKASTSVFKFNTSSAVFDGTSDSISATSNVDFDFGSGNFTVEVWVYPTTITSLRIICGNRPNTGFLEAGWVLYMDASGKLNFRKTSSSAQATITSTASLSLNAWNFLSVSRYGASTTQMHIGGTANGTFSTNYSIDNSNGHMAAGSDDRETGTRDWLGNQDQVRITKGVGRYTSSNYSVPTATFPHA
jgi:hypothetical protein